MQLPAAHLIETQVRLALEEDVGTGDLSAALIPKTIFTEAQIIIRESAIICGINWAEEVFRQVDPLIKVTWLVKDAAAVTANQVLAVIKGPAHAILTAERTALNFLQLMSGTATTTFLYVEKLQHTKTKILDTRKTIPGLRLAQKYAVRCVGGQNHRFGLYDAYLIKENHILACGSITQAVQLARQHRPEKLLEVEVENLEELQEALFAKVNLIMLDNFALEILNKAVVLNAGSAKLEASGNVSLDNIVEIAKTGVDYISIGALTKHIRAIDLSMRLSVTFQSNI